MTDKLIMGGAEVYFCKLENLYDQEIRKDLSFFTAAADGELFEKIKNRDNFILLTRKQHLFNILKLCREVKRHEIDVVHANSLRMVFYAIGIKMMTRKKLKIIYTKHNITFIEKHSQKLLAKLLNSSVDRTITVSDHERKSLLQMGVEPSKVTTIHNGVDLNHFPYQKKVCNKTVFHIGILGRLSEEKNHKLFIEIAKSLKKVPNLKFYIAGDGPEFGRIEDMIKHHDLTNNVKMLGAVLTPEKFITDMDVLLLTSHREVFPMVLLEAMAIGTPVISIDTGGVSEAVDNNKTGFLVSSYSVDAFVNKIMEMKSNDQIRSSFSENGRHRVERFFTSENMTKLTLGEYSKL
ncbi:glycosyltransferase family 4 protein [Alkalihalobacillus macyae]|uniref:glycosyltransferase family 4 protein n=1 Tax=Guptibacillus hwajinpoensis TaxID=208199 RepID=UPI00273C4B7E|nr:glycosyltransferase family 4 protein [Alkalihalobacillus macyae]MDP4552606.1 glycosyltransferase family 4 protein [Alkalihalobacillus macyae]